MLGAPTLVDAVQRTLRAAYGCASWVTEPTLAAQARMIAFDASPIAAFDRPLPAGLREAAHGKGLLVGLDVHDWAARGWSSAATWDRSTSGTRRVELLYGVFDTATVYDQYVTELLGRSELAESSRMRLRQAAVMSWWASRRAEGYDRTSALFLLRLIADARVFAAIEWLADGAPGPSQPAHGGIETEPA